MRGQNSLMAFGCLALLLAGGCTTMQSTNRTAGCEDTDKTETCLSANHGPRTISANYGDDDLSYPPSAFSAVVQDAPSVKAAEARIAAADAGIDKARALYMPTASLDASGTLRAADRHPSSSREPHNPYSYALTVRVPIYQGGRADSAVKLAQANKRVAMESARDVTLSTTYELALALVDIERFRNTLNILTNHEQKLKSLRRDVGAEREAGGATGVDTNDVERQLASLAVDRQQTSLLLAQSEETLLRLNAEHRLNVGALSILSRKLPSDEPSLMQLALDHNPRLSVSNARINVAEARVNQARSAYNANLVLDLSAGGDGNAVGYDHLDEASAVLKLSVPLFTGGARTAELQGSRDELLASRFDNDAARDGVRAALQSARNRLDQARAMVSASKREQSAAKSLLNGIRAERKLGERSVFDEIRAIGNLASAELNMNAARANVLSAEVTLAAESGVLDEFLGVSEPTGTEIASSN